MNLPDKKYRVILADPPWSFSNAKSKLEGLAATHYSCMKIPEIAALPVGDLADENCALFMWISATLLAEGKHLPIFKAWGFRLVTQAFTWIKTYRNGKVVSGLGFYTRTCTEPVVLGIKGSMPRAKEATNVSQLIMEPRRRHSQKPDEIYSRIEELYPEGPYLELFARQPREGWDGWGNEYPATVPWWKLGPIRGL
jgi:site-specific DNA-methyltransferase (adenine-specific)